MVDTYDESFGFVYRSLLGYNPTDCRDILSLIERIISNGAQDLPPYAQWSLASSSLPTDRYWDVSNSGADATGTYDWVLLYAGNQQIVIAARSNAIICNYLPDGGFVSFDYTVGIDPSVTTMPGKTQSGFRNINGTTINTNWNLALLSGAVSLGHYADLADDTYSLTIFFEGSSNNFLYGLHVGRILVPDNESDDESAASGGIGLRGDGVMVGIPQHPTSAAAPAGCWLVGGTTTGSTVRYSETAWSSMRVVWEDDSPVDTGLYAVAGIDKPIPYAVYSTSTGILGLSKYVRTMPVVVGHRFNIQSPADDSMQSWLGYKHTNTSVSKQVMLWCKHEQIVP